MEVFEPIWRKDYYDWKVKMINKTGLIYNFSEQAEGEMLLAQWYDAESCVSTIDGFTKTVGLRLRKC